MTDYLLVITGINAVISAFLMIVSWKALRKGISIVKYIFFYFALILVSSIVISLQYFGIDYFESYTQIILQAVDLVMLVLVYLGIMRGK
ncbi:MAG: hypothetical protein M1375_04160 [Candidatus Thermoplasmatota archaeon]|jgi:hypothetical protein|nr:hypothetical protein [Candidatus Thermoplasmatota archaeon]MCL5791149.1 hypothetical protein [Candidatus Thermoplasmatota archaeon]